MMQDKIKGQYIIYREMPLQYVATVCIPGCPYFTFEKSWESHSAASGAVKRIAEKLNLELKEVKL
jgi:hypothetical protein